MIVWRGRRIGVDLMEVPGERTSRSFEIVRFGQGVAILPVLDDGRIVLIRQYRPAVEAAILEIPAGKVEKGEDLLSAAARELHEETGITGADLRMMTSIWTTPGFCDEVIHIVLARGGTIGKAQPEEDEWIDPPVFYSWKEIDHLVRTGGIRDSKTLVALGWAGSFMEDPRMRAEIP
ncbi:MAG: NUDIX hydrolase [Nitrospirae bacterium]|nr:NUDIX hydrolase [Nitrospirota bacterium]